jgi:hypothetical protein
MKSGGPAAKKNKGKGLPLRRIVIGAIAVLFVLLAVFLWNECVIDEVKLNKLVGDTRIIANNLENYISTQNQGGVKISESWKEDLFSESFAIAGYRFGPLGFKTEFNDAKVKIDNLYSKKNEDLLKSFEALSKRKPEKGELLSKIIEKIKEVKTSSEKLALEEAKKKQIRNAEHQRQVEEQAKREQESAREKEKAIAEAQVVKSPTPAPTPVPQKIVKLEFWQPLNQEDTASKKYFKNGTVCSGWSWKTNNLATNILQLQGIACETNAWKTILVVNQLEFNKESINSGFCFLRKEDSSKEVTISITSSGEVFTNKIAFQPIELEKEGEKYICKLSTNIASCLQLFKTPAFSITYQIINHNYSGDAPESLAEQINQKLKSLDGYITTAQAKLEQSHSSNNQYKTEAKPSNPSFESLDKAGETLSQGLKFESQTPIKKEGFPEELKSFTSWQAHRINNKNPTERNKENFNNYLQEVFKYIYSCKGGLTYTFITTQWINKTHGAAELFQDITKNGSKMTPTEKSGERTSNDYAFKQNVDIYFTSENAKNLKDYLTPPPKPTPTPDYINILEDAKNNRVRFEESLKKPQAEIIIKDAKNTPLLIFTTQ